MNVVMADDHMVALPSLASACCTMYPRSSGPSWISVGESVCSLEHPIAPMRHTLVPGQAMW